MKTDYCIYAQNIKKEFGPVKALRGVDLKVLPGTIHALIGENGAGKSTLMNILGGVLQADSGKVFIKGKEIVLHRPADARKHRISFIHQELNLVRDLMVYENIFLGEEIVKRNGMLDKKEMIRRSAEILDILEVDLDPTKTVSRLSTSLQQVVEIARALRQEASLIIMDEPTTSLATHEIESIFKVMKNMRASGVSIIFISHKLKEVLEICQEYTVLRDGDLAGTGIITEETTEEHLVHLMVGKALEKQDFFEKRSYGEVVLRTCNLTLEPYFRNVNFTVRAGEVVGFTGLLGDGRSELFETVFGFRKATSGKVCLNGKDCCISSTKMAKNLNIGLVPKNRKENAIIKDLTIRENLTIASLDTYSSKGFVIRSQEEKVVNKYIKDINIKIGNMNDLITSLSGGNQQKVILGKWIAAESEVLILDNPTQGIDVGAKVEIYHVLMKLAQSGKAIIVLSSEFSEIQKICDRVYVMFHGDITGELPRKEATDKQLMLYTTGVKRDSHVQEKVHG